MKLPQNILYIEARKKFGKIDYTPLNGLPGKTISLAVTIQYLSLVPEAKKYLQSLGKKTLIGKGPVYEAQVLGCNSQAFNKDADTLLLITDGKFHALNNALQLNKEIYVFNTHTLEKVTEEDIKKIKARKLGAVKKFLSSNEVGILVSTKPGQNYPQASKLKEKIAKLGKKSYIFESDNINTQELENFQLPVYINTACYGLASDSSNIVNLQDISEYLN